MGPLIFIAIGLTTKKDLAMLMETFGLVRQSINACHRQHFIFY